LRQPLLFHDCLRTFPRRKHFRKDILRDLAADLSTLDEPYQLMDVCRFDFDVTNRRPGFGHFCAQVVDDPVGDRFGTFGAFRRTIKIIGE